ncbi:MAG: hypothetical protein WBP12_05395 [Candidatus Saccharimonas sp.]
MTIPATFNDLEVETYIAARDARQRSDQELAQIAIATAKSLSTLDIELAQQAERTARVERVTCYLQAFIAWAKQNDWPGFYTSQVVVGTRLETKPTWRGLLGHSSVPDTQRRSIYTLATLGVTNRGEFIYNGVARGLTPRIIDTSHPQFHAVRFEEMLLELLEYYKIPIPS